MRYDAKEQLWEGFEIKGATGYFCDLRIDRKTVPEEFHLWELADGDSDGMPCRYRPGIMVNFFGTLITKDVLPVIAGTDGDYLSEEEWSFTGESFSFEELCRRTSTVV